MLFLKEVEVRGDEPKGSVPRSQHLTVEVGALDLLFNVRKADDASVTPKTAFTTSFKSSLDS